WLEGRTQEEAAQLLGASLSTVRRRLECGKRLLQARLERRGLAPAVGLAAPPLALAIPERALAGAVRGSAATARATALAHGALAATGKVRLVIALLLAACVAAAGVGLAANVPSFTSPSQPPAAAVPPQQLAKEDKRVDALGDPLPPGALLRLGS